MFKILLLFTSYFGLQYSRLIPISIVENNKLSIQSVVAETFTHFKCGNNINWWNIAEVFLAGL